MIPSGVHTRTPISPPLPVCVSVCYPYWRMCVRFVVVAALDLSHPLLPSIPHLTSYIYIYTYTHVHGHGRIIQYTRAHR